LLIFPINEALLKKKSNNLNKIFGEEWVIENGIIIGVKIAFLKIK